MCNGNKKAIEAEPSSYTGKFLKYKCNFCVVLDRSKEILWVILCEL